MKKKKEIQIRYYNDELNDDFGNPNHSRKDVFHSFDYKRHGFPKIGDNIFYYGFAIPALSTLGRIMGYKIIGKHNLKTLKHYVKNQKKGFFIYSNHAGIYDVIENLMLGYPRRVNTIGYSDPLSIPVARHLVRSLGFLPLPTNIRDLPEFQSILEYYVLKEAQGISLFPEAHLWPYYTNVRNFKRSSFRYPALFNVPTIPVFNQRRERKGFWKLFPQPRVTMYVGPLIFPDPNLSFKENQKMIGDKTYEFMKTIADNVPHEDRVKYVYKEKEAITKMTILFVCDVLGQENNGTTIAAMNIIRYLKENGHNVRVLCCDKDKIGQEGYFVLPTLNAGPFNAYVEKNGVSLAKIDKKIIESAFDGVDICHIMMPLFLGKYCAKYAHKKKIKLTAGFHVQAENVSNHFFLMNLKFANIAFYKNFYKKLYRYCDAIHYPTNFIKTTFEKIVGTTPGYVISNGVKKSFVKIENVERPDDLKNKIIILSIGRYSKEKAQSILISAVSKSKYKNDIQLILAGSGPLEEKLRSEGNVLPNKPIMKFFSHDEIVKTINISDLYVHTAEVEIEAISCLEALTCGLVPVIADSSRSATKYFALDERNLFKNNNSSDLAEKIDYWIEHPEEKKECSDKYLGFTKQFNFDNCMKKMEDMFLDVLTSVSYKK